MHNINIKEVLICKKILDWLSRYQQISGYDSGGIKDSIDRRVIGDHYATTHFAWACALEKLIIGEYSRLEKAKNAILFHIRTSKDEYSPGKWSYHWDFNNLALASCYHLLKIELSEDEQDSWVSCMASWKTNSHGAINWVAMRAAAFWLRSQITGFEADSTTSLRYLERVLAAQLNDGCIEDLPGKSRPSQYHAYTACLLNLMRPAAPDQIRHAVLNAADWLLALTTDDGDMNVLGRGQGQIFGYACGLYLYRAAGQLDPKRWTQYSWAIRKIRIQLATYFNAEGYFPLVFNELPVTSKAGWYDYHHLSVYNSFAAVWLLLAETLKHPQEDEIISEPERKNFYSRGSGVLSLKSGRVQALFSCGSPNSEYATDCGITPHLLRAGDDVLFKYPFGPGPGKYGQNSREEHQEENCWCPLAFDDNQEVLGPFAGQGEMAQVNDNQWKMTYIRDGLVWQRSLFYGQHYLHAEDSLTTQKRDTQLLRSINLALKESGTTRTAPASFTSSGGSVIKFFGDSGTHLSRFRTLQAANGKINVYASKEQKCGHIASEWRVRVGPNHKEGIIPPILCISWDPWSSLWKRKQKLMHEMSCAKNTRGVLYIEPPVSTTELLENALTLFKNSNLGKRYRRFLSRKRNKINDNFFLASPLWLFPGQRSFPSLRTWNIKIYHRFIRKQIQRCNLSSYILWVYHPHHLEIVKQFGKHAELIVYDWTDDWVAAAPEHYTRQEKEYLAQQQEALLERADIVFAVSEELCRRAKKFCQWVYYLPNATDLNVFRPSQQKNGTIGHTSIKFPALVYLSQITDRVDFLLLSKVASRRPEWQFYMVGPVICSPALFPDLERLDNVHFLGKLPYQQAAEFVSQCNICILPHKQNELTMTLDPIKLYDYLATGLPIIATNVAMHPDLKQYVQIVNNADQFEMAIVATLDNAPNLTQISRAAAAQRHTWPIRAQEVTSILGRFFPEKRE